MAELVDALDSKSCGLWPCQFKSDYPYHLEAPISSELFSYPSTVVNHLLCLLLYNTDIRCHILGTGVFSIFKKHKRTIADAMAYYQSGDYSAARQAAEYLLDKNSSDAAALLLMGNVCFVNGEYADAAKYYRRLLHDDSQNQEALINLFEALLRQKKYPEAGQIIPLLTDTGYEKLAQGKLAFEQEDFAAAENNIVKYLQNHPADFWTWNLLSQAAQKNGHFTLALDAAWQAVEQSGGADSQHLNLAYALYEIALEKGRDFVAPYLQNWCRKYADNGIVKQSKNSFFPAAGFIKSDPFYVRQVFDNFADSFEEILQGLEYSVPQKIADIVAQKRSLLSDKPCVLDIGCGTGLAAEKLDSLFVAKQFFGVDISQQMLQKSAAKKLYQKLFCDDAEHFLSTHKNMFNLIVAADVFTYFGALENLLNLCADSLQKNGVIVFSASAGCADKNGWQQHLSGRFLHGETYLQKTLSAAGFKEPEFAPCRLRKEAEKTVKGWIIFARKK